VVSAARTLIDAEQLNVPDYNNDAGKLAKVLTAANLSISKSSFEAAARARIDNLVFNSKEEAWLAGRASGTFPRKYKPQLITLIKKSPIRSMPQYRLSPHRCSFRRSPATTDATAEPMMHPRGHGPGLRRSILDDQEPSAEVSSAAISLHGTAPTRHDREHELDVFGLVDYFHPPLFLRGDLESRNKRLSLTFGFTCSR
jgi:hypothetical protein